MSNVAASCIHNSKLWWKYVYFTRYRCKRAPKISGTCNFCNVKLKKLKLVFVESTTQKDDCERCYEQWLIEYQQTGNPTSTMLTRTGHSEFSLPKLIECRLLPFLVLFAVFFFSHIRET